MSAKRSLLVLIPVLIIAGVVGLPMLREAQSQGAPFQIEEATIADVHRAILAGRTTCRKNGSSRSTSRNISMNPDEASRRLHGR